MPDSTPIKIDTGIPVPTGDGRTKYPWKTMKPGDSFFGPQNAGNGLGDVRKLFPGTKWTSRTVTENGVKGTRIWRLT